jgi:hypothetical protein
MIKPKRKYSPSNLGWFELHAVDHCNLNCLNCNHHSLFFKKKEYRCEDYFPWIDEMKRRKIKFGTIGILGGEAFLHSDLASFCKGFKKRYGCRMLLTTNGFWLKSREDQDQVLRWVDEIIFSIYQPIEESMSRDVLETKLDGLQRRNPHLTVRRRDHIRTFAEVKFTSEPEIPSSFCDWQANCTNLLPDGRLARCGVGAYAHKNPAVTEEFLRGANDMFYDLSVDDGRDFKSWKQKYPLEGCKFCSMWKVNLVPWQNVKTVKN